MKCPHCDTSIDEHEASLCLNAWVAEAVMDHGKVSVCFMLNDKRPSESFTTSNHPLRYSTDIAAAWEVVGRMKHVSVYSPSAPIAGEYMNSAETWGCEIMPLSISPDEWRYQAVLADGESAPLAICRAALKAVGE